MNNIIQTHLDSYYEASVLKKSDTTPIKQSLLDAFDKTPTLRTEAVALLSNLRSMSNRCFISKIHANFLEDILNG